MLYDFWNKKDKDELIEIILNSTDKSFKDEFGSLLNDYNNLKKDYDDKNKQLNAIKDKENESREHLKLMAGLMPNVKDLDPRYLMSLEVKKAKEKRMKAVWKKPKDSCKAVYNKLQRQNEAEEANDDVEVSENEVIIQEGLDAIDKIKNMKQYIKNKENEK